jgi:Leucine-rich repeat (LRR) protein
MSGNTSLLERYESFSGLSCDINSNQLIVLLEKNINNGNGDKKWHDYFAQKRQQQAKSGHDNLHFIGNQTNILYEYFADCGDQEAQALLYKIEQECC